MVMTKICVMNVALKKKDFKYISKTGLNVEFIDFPP